MKLDNLLRCLLRGAATVFITVGSCAAEVDFQKDVRPILSGICFKCHGPDESARKGKLRLDIRDEALKPAKSGGIAIVPGDVAKSEVVKRVFATDEDDVMPPPAAKHPLTDAQKQVLKDWIAQGAEYKAHWAFVAPQAVAPPEVKLKEWVRNDIDAFILARLEKEGLKPSERADSYALVRRVYLDLIGLPPTPEEADAFVNDHSEKAYEHLVDRLLDSPHYGERWARRWLDLARYADTNGYEKDRPRSIWAYRDWVINALNKDIPFDEFTIEQLAGDLLPNATPEQIIATGFHRNTMLNEEGGADPLEYRFHAMVDRVHVTATTWLGLTMACAQCHTHKYDPIQHTEYYGFMGLMDNADEPLMDVVKSDIAEKRKKAEEKIAALEAGLLEKFPAPSNIEWRSPGEVEFASEGGADGEFLTDGSFRVTGKNPDKDTYTLKFETTVPKLTHVMIEALPDAAVGKGGPGRTDHGNFVVSEVELEVAGQKVKFGGAEADFTQEGFSPDGTFDGKNETGWAIAGPENLRQDRHLILRLAGAVTIEKGAKVVMKIGQQYGGKHTLGRFRVSMGQEVFSGSVAEKRKENLEKKFAAWVEKEKPNLFAWQRLKPVEATGDHPTLNVEADDVIFAQGDFTKNDTYTLKFANVPAGTRAIRIEALPDSRLPGNGPGRVFYEGSPGDFFLSNLKASAGEKAIKFKSASQSFPAGGNTAEKAFDEDLQSGWSVNGQQGKRNVAVFQLAEPFAGGDLKIEMTMERYYASALGKFRISATTDENAVASAIPEDAYEILLKHKGPGDGEERAVVLNAFAQAAPELASARREIEKARAEMPKFPTTLVLRERDPEHRRVTYRHHRGEWLQPKEEVKPGVPAFLPPLPAGAPANRLGLAKWLVSKENPLTARVVMNRNWEAFFGRGLVKTMEDFGFQGEMPTHPQLLDWLAVEFMKRNWSMKQMHKLIVMSAAYQQSSRVTAELLEKDPNNILLSRGARFREDAEIVRDSALAASGLLTEKIGGPSVFPPQLPSITTEGAYGPLQWKVSEGGDRYRRSLYTFAKRTAPFAMALTFDGPSGEACLARRDRSNTPLQALNLLNDEIFMDCSKALGRWAAGQGQAPDATVEQMFRRFATRPPTEQEKAKLVKFYQEQLERFAKGELKAAELAGDEKGEKLNERASWIAVARVLLNLDEAITKS